MRNNTRFAVSLLVSCAAAGLAAPLAAQEADNADNAQQAQDSGLGEIIVTARRRSENLQQVPVATSAFNDEVIRARGINDTIDLSNAVPNVQFDFTSSFSGASSSFQGFIRGIGQSDFAINTDPGVGVYIDGVYIARTVGSVVDLLDVERVEVLKGPQGTLFGRNSIGGAINVTTRDPGYDTEFQGLVQVGNFNQFNTAGSLSLPLGEELGATIAFSTKSRDGYQKRIPFPFETTSVLSPLGSTLVADSRQAGDHGAEDNQTLRAKLVYDSGPVKVSLSGDYSRIRDAAAAGTLLAADLDPIDSLSGLYNACVLGLAPQGLCAISPFIPYGANVDGDPNNDLPLYDNRFITGDIDTTYATGANFSNMDVWGGSLAVEYDLGGPTLKSITAYRKLDATFGRDVDESPLDIDQATFSMDQNQLSQELQLNGPAFDAASYTLGAYYFREKASQIDFVPLGQGLLQIFGPNAQKATAWAVFGETTIELTERLSVVLGGRYTEERKRLDLDQQNLTGFFDAVLPPDAFPRADHRFLGPEETQKANFTDFSIRAGANYRFTDDIFGYVSFSQGFKSGGFTTRLTAPYNPDFAGNTSLPSLAFEPEEAENYEIGLKTELFNRNVRLNMAAFWNNYNNIQVVVLRGITPANENAAKGRIRGFEAELDALVADNLRIGGALGYLDAEYRSLDFPAGAEPFGLDASFQNTPEWTASGSVQYTVPIENGSELNFNVNGSYRSAVFRDAENTPLLRQPGYFLLNAAVSYTFPNEQVTLSVGGRNITDKRYIVGGFSTNAVGFTEATFSRPAEWYARVEYEF